MKVAIEEVTPEMAKVWLAKSKGNRQIRDAYVLSLAVDLEAGRWVPEASDVVFDTTGALIDGHHRLSAIVMYEAPARMCVKRDVPPEARNVIDTGRTRSMTDLLGMYRNVDYPTARRSALNMAVRLLQADGSQRPMIRTLDVYDVWMKQFKDGIDWVIASTLQAGLSLAVGRSFSTGPVLGAFAFAHKLNPAGVAKFHLSSVRGEGLSAGDPALALRNAILSDRAGRNMGGGGRYNMALKVLSAIYSDLHGERSQRLYSNAHAVAFFRAAYKGRAVDKLTQPWEATTAPKSEAAAT